jgi:CRP/FNR family transcriptional regulator, cyclic AMP receptor protein
VPSIESLERIPLFRDLEARTLREIAGLTRPRLYRPREVVFRQGDPGDGLFVIATGYLKASISGPTGTATTLAIMGPSEMFGELSLLDGNPRSASVAAVTRAELMTIDRASFLRLFESRPRLGITIMEVVARRLRRLSERSDDLTSLPVPNRLAKQLLQLAESHAFRVAPRRLRLALKLSQRDLGELVGATRESVNKYLRRWSEEGVLDEENGFLVVADLERLRQIAAAEDESDRGETPERQRGRKRARAG